mgnify:CR=1 FL=1
MSGENRAADVADDTLCVPVRVTSRGTTTEYQMPMTAEFKECRQVITEMHREQLAAVEKATSKADLVIQASLKPHVDALAAAVEDCESMFARMSQRTKAESGIDERDSDLFRLAADVGALYAKWSSKPVDPSTESIGTTTDQAGQSGAVQEEVPLYIIRLARAAAGEWKTPEIININANKLDKIFSADELKLLRSYKMHKHPQRVVVFERSLDGPDGEMTLTFAFVFAVHGEARVDIALANGTGAPEALSTDRDIMQLFAFMNCYAMFDVKPHKSKVEAQKAAALCYKRIEQVRTLYEQRRLVKRQDRLLAIVPGIVLATIGGMSRDIAAFYDITGVKVPDETIIIDIQVFNGAVVFDDCAIVRHTQSRALLEAEVAKLKQMQAKLAELRDAQKEPTDTTKAAVQEARAEYSALLAKYHRLREIDRAALECNTRNQLVISLSETSPGLDAQEQITMQFLFTLNVPRLIKSNEKVAARLAEEKAAVSTEAQEPAVPTTSDEAQLAPTQEPAQPAATATLPEETTTTTE